MIDTAYRVTKARYPVFDGTGAERLGGRWNSAGRPVVYCADSMAGSLIEILVHANAPLKPPGLHHCGRAHLPRGVRIETVEPETLIGWEDEESGVARAFGDRWFDERRTAVLVVPSATVRPYGRNVLLNPMHAEFDRIRRDAPAEVVWDPRLFR